MRWQRSRDGLSLFQCHVAWTAFIKHQPNRIHAGFGGSECIGFTSDAANLDGDAHLTIPAQSNFAAVLDAARDVALLEVLLGNLAIHAFRRLEGANRFAAFGEVLEFFVALRLAAWPSLPEFVALHGKFPIEARDGFNAYGRVRANFAKCAKYCFQSTSPRPWRSRPRCSRSRLATPWCRANWWSKHRVPDF